MVVSSSQGTVVRGTIQPGIITQTPINKSISFCNPRTSDRPTTGLEHLSLRAPEGPVLSRVEGCVAIRRTVSLRTQRRNLTAIPCGVFTERSECAPNDDSYLYSGALFFP